MLIRLVGALAIGYLLGSIPTGYLVGRVRGVDIRQWGSGATGGTNVLRTLGVGAALLTGVVDILKGMAGAVAGYVLGGDWGYALGGFAALAGHSYPVWLKFRGGKSVATGAGTIVLFHPWVFLIGLAAGVAALIPTRFVSLGSLVGALVLAVAMIVSGAPLPHKLLAVGALLVVYIRHWENMKRLAKGTENKFGQKAKPRAQP